MLAVKYLKSSFANFKKQKGQKPWELTTTLPFFATFLPKNFLAKTKPTNLWIQSSKKKSIRLSKIRKKPSTRVLAKAINRKEDINV